MEERRIAIFGTSSIQSDAPADGAQRPVYERVSRRGGLLRVYSSGKLETAHRRDMDIYVVSMLPLLDDCHRWWQALVPPSHVFLTEGLLKPFGIAELDAILLDPWKRLYAALRLPWPEGIVDPDHAKAALIACGITDGATLPGHGTH